MRRSARWALGILGELLSNAKPGRRYAGPPLTTNGGGRALVTGGTGGIGEEVCRGLAARGYDVYVGARDAAKGEAVAERLREECPGAHKCLVCDLNGGDRAAEGRQPAGQQRRVGAPPPTRRCASTSWRRRG